ncbi:PhzF family phenazine biosynthesis protein [bacterium]|nr:PhzF family phenazine biosynthesis protein [bacterium]RQV92054.1 MAG: PhzF family phenazine biosynthesis protein [bacterium]
MNGLTFYIVDVFAEEKYSGNQLAVVRHAERLSETEMQRIAREMHFSETTFVLSDQSREGGFDVRIFTPENEVDFAGHPTLGTAYVIQKKIIQIPVERIVLNLKVGPIPVSFQKKSGDHSILWMQQIHPTFGSTLPSEQLAEVLCIDTNMIDTRFPIEQVSTGLPFIIVPLTGLSALKQIKINSNAYDRLTENLWAKIILVFAPEGHHKTADLSVRVFPLCFGIPEDPATGSGNGCLAGYLVKHRYFGQPEIDLKVSQGHEIKRPSLLHLKARETGQNIDIQVGGRVIEVAEGQLI